MKGIKILIAAFIISTLVGCKTRTVIEYQDVYVPIPYVPMPPEIDEPDYYATELTEEQRELLGELAKAFVISSREAVDYGHNLKQVYDLFVDLAKSSKERIESLKEIGADFDDSFLRELDAEYESKLQSLSGEMELRQKLSAEKNRRTLQKDLDQQ